MKANGRPKITTELRRFAVTAILTPTLTAAAPPQPATYALLINGGGQPRPWALAALDPTTGLAKSWDPQPDGAVDRLLLDGDRAFVSGFFTEIGGQPRRGLAALDLVTGTALPWDPASPGIAAIRGPGPSSK